MANYWRVEYRKKTSIKVRSFTDRVAAMRLFQKHRDAKISTYEGVPGVDLKLIEETIAGDFEVR